MNRNKPNSRTVLLLAGSIILVLISPAFGQTVAIPDPGLEKAVRQALGKPSDPLTGADLASLTELNAAGQRVVSLQGLEAASNLIRLDLRFNGLTNLTIPSGLTHLQELDLGSNLIQDLAFLDGLTQLTSLDLSVNLLNHVTLPASLTGLVSLNLAYNQLTDLTLPTPFPQLKTLDVGGNRLTDFSFLSQLPALTSLKLNGNNLSSISLPSGLDHLLELNLANNHLSDLSNLQGLSGLLDLSLYGNNASSVTLPTDLTQLERLNLGANDLSDFGFLRTQTQLTSLDLSDNQLTDLTLPPELNQLRELTLEANRLNDLSFLINLSSLTSLNLRANHLTSVTLPPGLTNLTDLSLGVNLLGDLSFLQGLGSLKTLDLSANELTNLPLSDTLSNLTDLEISFNDLTNLTVPVALAHLEDVSLIGNPIAEITLPAANSDLISALAHLRNNGVQLNVLPVLTVNALGANAAVSILITPPDAEGNSQGVTPLTRAYAPGTLVNLTAPQNAQNSTFQKWLKDGADLDTALTVQLAMDANHTVTAVYTIPPESVFSVPEASDYTQVYSLDLPDQADFRNAGVPYSVDNHLQIGPFSRIAYYLQLQPQDGPAQALWLSMDAFTSRPERIGVPTFQSRAFFQQPAKNLNVFSTVPGIVTGTGLTGGSLEFWWGNYSPGNQLMVPGASDALYDFGDAASPADPPGYGSMQVHNWEAGQTLFAFNGWGAAPDAIDLGIGNAPGTHPDWTYARNAGTYRSKNLQVFVLPAEAVRNVPEAANYTLLYSLEIPDQARFNETGVPYRVDNHLQIGSYTRIAYYLELQPQDGPVQYLWVSMDAFTNHPEQIGVPTVQSGGFFQRPVNHLNVFSSVPGIVTGTGLTGGSLEFWWGNYESGNGANVPGASDAVFDFGDTSSPNEPAGYGSMQVHNLQAGQTLLAFNGWGEASNAIDLGIGNAPGPHSDWTYAANAGSYVTKRLQVYVLQNMHLE